MERNERIATVYVPKQLLGRNPDHLIIKTDNFNLDAILSTIDKVSNATDKIANAANNAATVVNKAGQVIQTVKDASGQVKQIITQPVYNTGYTAYPAPNQPLQAGFGGIDNNVLLMVGGSVLAIIVAMLVTR